MTIRHMIHKLIWTNELRPYYIHNITLKTKIIKLGTMTVQQYSLRWNGIYNYPLFVNNTAVSAAPKYEGNLSTNYVMNSMEKKSLQKLIV